MGKGVTEGSGKSAANITRADAALVAGLAVLGLWMAACLWYPLTDTDIWWHLAAARWMLEHGAVPRTDPFAISSLGRPWIDLHWGFQLLTYGLWNLGGAAALVAGKVGVMVTAFWLALRPYLRAGNAVVLLPLAAFGTLHIRFFLDVRPLIITLLGLSLLHLATLAHLDGRLRRPWAVLLPIQIVLANMQGLYPLGAFLVTCLLIGAWWERRRMPTAMPISLRPLALTTAGLWLAGLATPYGWPGFLLPLSLLARITPLPGNVFSSEIAENQPLPALALHDPRALIPWLIILIVVLWTYSVQGRERMETASRRPQPRAGMRASGNALGHALILAGFAVLGLMAQRNLPLFVLAAILAAGRNLQVTQDGPTPVPTGLIGRWARRPWIAPAAVVLIAALYFPRIRQAWAYELPGSLETPFRFPARAADYLADHELPGRLFNELRFGGYLAWRLYPARLVYVDGRMILRDAAFYRDFLDVVDRPDGFPAYAARQGLTLALLPIGEDRRFLPLAASLLGREKWSMLFCDGSAVLLAEPAVAGNLALPLDAFPEDHPALVALRERFGANPRLEAIARRNLEALLRQAGLSPEPD